MKTLRLAICLVLIVGVLAMSLSVFAVDASDRVKATEYVWAYYIYQFLKSIGIDVSYKGIVEYTDEVQDTIIDWVVNYIADLIEADSQPSNYSIAQWIAPWQAEYDYWGNLKFNSTMLEDMQDFAEWLKAKFSLIDDNRMVYNPTFTLEGYNLYNINTYYLGEPINGGNALIVYVECTSGNPDAKYFIAKIGNTFNLVYVDPNGGKNLASFGVRGYDIDYKELQSSGDAFNPYGPNNNGITYHEIGTFCIPTGGNYLEVTDIYALLNWMSNAELKQSGDIEIITGSIVMPSSNPDYTQGDGVTIIDGVPKYSVINIDDVTVDNLPAIITQRNIPDIGNDSDNPGFSVPWQAINGLIQYVAAPAGAIIAIVNEAPVEGVIMLYALIGGIIIFGMIRIMREH